MTGTTSSTVIGAGTRGLLSSPRVVHDRPLLGRLVRQHRTFGAARDRLSGAASLGLICILILGCGGASAPPAQQVIDIFDTGSWALSLNATDCGDLLTKMSTSEQFAVSRSLLATVRMNTLATAPAPADATVTRFKNDMAALCRTQASDYPIIAAAAVVYTSDKSYEPVYR